MLFRSALDDYPKRQPARQFYLFSYEERDPLTGQAKAGKIHDEKDKNDFGTAG